MLLKFVNMFHSILSFTMDGTYKWILEAIGIVLLVLIINFFAKRGLEKLHLYFERTNQIWKDSFVQSFYRPLSAYIWFYAFFQLIDLISHRVFEGTIFSNLPKVLSIGLVSAIAWFLMRWKKAIIFNMHLQSLKHDQPIDSGKIDVINKMWTIIILFLTALSVLEITGQNINTLIAFGGVGGLAIAFASQEMIANFFGGLMVYVTQPFTVGDWINLPERKVEGNVEEIGWYMTRVRTFEKRPIYIPNSMFSKVVVMNPARMSHRKFDEIIGIRYSDMPVARHIISDITTMLIDHFHVDRRLGPTVNLEGFGSYAVNIHISAYLLDIDHRSYIQAKQEILFSIYNILNKHGAEIALPTSLQLYKEV